MNWKVSYFNTSLSASTVCTERVYKHSAAVGIGEQKIMITGGFDQIKAHSRVLILDAKNGTMITVAPMHIPRYYHALVLLKGKPIAIGGNTGGKQDDYPIEEYDM